MVRTVDPMTIDGFAFVLILLVLPVVSFGTMEDNAMVWGGGLVLLMVGSIIPLVMEFWVTGDPDGD